jgi:gas vesicle protein
MNKDFGIGFLYGAVTGIIIGSVLGLLYAPKSGEETREIISSKASELKTKADNLIKKIKHAEE